MAKLVNIDNVVNRLLKFKTGGANEEVDDAIDALCFLLLEEPSAVTRCGDCEHHYTADCPLHFEYNPLDDWFCADGEPRKRKRRDKA